MTYFTARPTLVFRLFYRKKVKTVDLLETIGASDLKLVEADKQLSL